MPPTTRSSRRSSPTNSRTTYCVTGCVSTPPTSAAGLLGNFGRNARLIRETELEADRLAPYLLDRAGYDPDAAVRFWRRFGNRGFNIFGSPTHGGWRERRSAIEAEIVRIRQARAAGAVPMPAFVTLPLRSGR